MITHSKGPNCNSIYIFDRRNLGQTNFPARHVNKDGRGNTVSASPCHLKKNSAVDVSEGESYMYPIYCIYNYRVCIYIFFDIITYIFICRPIHTYPNYIFLC